MVLGKVFLCDGIIIIWLLVPHRYVDILARLTHQYTQQIAVEWLAVYLLYVTRDMIEVTGADREHL
jgi:hypothetical protein